MRLFLLAVSLLLTVACADKQEILLSQRDDDYGDNLWVNYLRGDTIQLYAREVRANGDPTATASAISPDLYTWTSETADVVEVIGPGRLVMKGTGKAELAVRGPNTTRHFTVWSYPPDAKVRFGPRDTTLNIGEIMRITIIVIDGAGKVIQTDEERQSSFAVAWGSNTSGMVLDLVSASDPRYWRAQRSGFTTIRGGIALYQRLVLSDSVIVTVR